MTDLERLEEIRTSILEALRTKGAKVNYNIDGQSVSYDSLFDRLDKINAQIAAINGPVELITEGY